MKSILRSIIEALVRPFGYELLRIHPMQRPWRMDQEFIAIFDTIRDRTVVQIDRLFMIYQYVQHTRSIPGDMAELGVYKGGTAKLALTVTEGTGKTMHLFDTFDGMPASEQLQSFSSERGTFTDTSLEAVRAFVGEERVVYHPGIFPKTTEGLEPKTYSYVYLDADLYDSTKNGLHYFWPKMSAGGVIIVDDYGSRHWYGIKKAVSEFAQSEGVSPIISAPFQCVLIKH